MIAVSLSTTFPSGTDYVAAIQNPGVSFSDADLRGGAPELNKHRIPKPISGNFASVFALTATDGRRYAVKCFTRDVPDQRERYEAISRHLAAVVPSGLSQPWKMDFKFLPEQILVNGRRWPVVKMAWVEGAPLDRWLTDHRRDRPSIRALADRFVALVSDLERLKIAHGDLQHGNLLVAADNSLRLVDYDGMYVPALATRGAAELGHRHYQAPTRGTRDFGETIDRFSAWVIYLSLMALAVEPLLWDHLREPGAEYLLTSDEDYRSPAGSWRLDQISSISPEIKGIAEQIRQYAQTPLDAIPALVPLVQAMPRTSPVSQPLATTSATPTSPGRPAWLEGHLAFGQGGESATRFTRRHAIDWVIAVVFAFYILAVVTNEFIGFLSAPYKIGAFGFCVWLVGEGRRRRPEWRAAKAARKSRQAQLKSLSAAAASMKRMTDKFTRSNERLTRRLAETDRERTGVETRRTQERQAIDRRAAGAIAGIDQQLRSAEDTRQRSVRDELRRTIDAHVATELRRHTILTEIKDISGLGPAAARTLAGYGIVSAADVHVTLVHGSGGYNTRVAYFHLPHGHQTRIEGIGEKKANALQHWRDGLVVQAQYTAPTTLPQARMIQLNQQHAALIAQLKAERNAAQGRAVTEKETLNRQLAVKLAALDDHKRRSESERAVGRAAYERNSSQARTTAYEYERAKQASKVERRAQRRLNHLYYLRFSLLGR
jgi:hypothetical protein